MFKVFGKKDKIVVIPTKRTYTYDEKMYLKLYKSVLFSNVRLATNITLLGLFMALFYIMFMYKDSVNITIPLLILLVIILILMFLFLYLYYRGLKDTLLKVRKLKSLSKKEFVSLMNILLEYNYPILVGNDKYYISNCRLIRNGCIINNGYYIVRRYDTSNVYLLLGEYIMGYSISLSAMVNRIDYIKFNELKGLHSTDLNEWEVKLLEIISV